MMRRSKSKKKRSASKHNSTSKFKAGPRKKELHAAWSFVVRQRDDYVCQWCLHDGKHNVSTKHHGHHIVARSLCGNNGAFDVDNGMTLCFHCHIDRLKSEVDEYIAFRDAWVKHNLGTDYQTMREKYRPFIKFTEEFYELKKQSLEYVYQQQGGQNGNNR
jgi:hypothetical protein